jgi:hypothetical protein
VVSEKTAAVGKSSVPAEAEAGQPGAGRGHENRYLRSILAWFGGSFDVGALPLVARAGQADGARCALGKRHDAIGPAQRIGRYEDRFCGVSGGGRGGHAQKKRPAPGGLIGLHYTE